MRPSIQSARLLESMAIALAREVLPKVQSDSTRFVVRAACRLALRQAMGLAATSTPQNPTSSVVSNPTCSLLQWPQPDAEALISALATDARMYAEGIDKFAQKLDELTAPNIDACVVPDGGTLSRYLRERFQDPTAEALNVSPVVGGYSKQTVLFDYLSSNGVTTSLVMRRDLPRNNVGTTVVDEFMLLKAVFQTGFPVAEPLWLEETSSVIPGAFLVSRRVAGRATGNPLGIVGTLEFDPARMLAKLLARLHAIDVKALGVPGISDVSFGEDVLQQRIDYWEREYSSNVESSSSALEIGLAWLKANVHLGLGDAVLVHGEIGFHNILFDGSVLTALLDWELAHLGSAADDLAYVRPFVESFMAFDKFLMYYAQEGRSVPPRSALVYYQVFANVRNAIIGVKSLRGFHDGLHDDLPLVSIVADTAPVYVGTLRRILSDIIREHGFRWEQGLRRSEKST